jgi:hypothetical protein
MSIIRVSKQWSLRGHDESECPAAACYDLSKSPEWNIRHWIRRGDYRGAANLIHWFVDEKWMPTEWVRLAQEAASQPATAPYARPPYWQQLDHIVRGLRSRQPVPTRKIGRPQTELPPDVVAEVKRLTEKGFGRTHIATRLTISERQVRNAREA